MKKLSILSSALAIALVGTIIPIVPFGLTANVLAAPPNVVCVPATGLNPIVPHDTWSGLETRVKGTAHDPDGDTTLATYE